MSSPEPHVDKDVVHSLLSINHTVRAWALDPAGMLRRNRLIPEPEVAMLEQWLDVIERIVLRYLNGNRAHFAQFAYVEYLARSSSRPTAQQQFIIPTLLQLAESGDSDYQIPALVVLGKFGNLVSGAVPILRRLLTEARDPEVRAACDVALRDVESESV